MSKAFVALPLLLLLPLAACAGRSDPNLYVMAPAAARSEAVQDRGPVVAVVRVRMPDYLDRREIVSRQGANALHVADNDQWGEPLDEGVPRVLAENLSHDLAGGRVVAARDAHGLSVPYEYFVTLDSYEPTDGVAVMRGHWQLRDTGSRQVLAEGVIDQQRPIAAHGYGAMVQALNDDLNDSSRQIAEATEARIHRP
jgi:hypothetical protein